MKIIEAMKKVKDNKKKIEDLRSKILNNAAHLDFEKPLYGDGQQAQINSWLQTCHDIVQDNVNLLVAIARTNQNTKVTIEIGGKQVEKTIAEWVWRRREYAAQDMLIVQSLNDRGLKEGRLPVTTGGEPTPIHVIRYYDPAEKDRLMEVYRSEPSLIDSALEIVNATTDLWVDNADSRT